MNKFSSVLLASMVIIILAGCANTGITGEHKTELGKVIYKKVLNTKTGKEEVIREQTRKFGMALVLTANHTFSICALLTNCKIDVRTKTALYKVKFLDGRMKTIIADNSFFRLDDCVLFYIENDNKKLVMARSCRGYD